MTKREATDVLSVGNHKLSKRIASWSLPASQDVCGRECQGCYAIKAQRVYPNVLPSRLMKFELSKSPHAFRIKVNQAVRKLRPTYVRIHDSGEFYSQEYINNWADVIKVNTDVTFYAYTKRLRDFDFTRLKLLPNMVLIDSLKHKGLNYGSLEARPDGMFQCPDYKGSELRKQTPSGPICGTLCTYCMTKDAEDTGVYFKKH